MEQWWVKAAPLAEKAAIAAVEQGKTQLRPRAVDEDVHALDDQHQATGASRASCGGAIASRPGTATRAARSRSSRTDLASVRALRQASSRQDDDILDTWFSSALWPFSTLGWPDKTRELTTFYPNNVLVTGPDIIFFWVARMMMMGLHFMGKVPFRIVYLTSIVTDENGDKMSKTKGNVIDPLDVVHGATLEQLLERADERTRRPTRRRRPSRSTFGKGIAADGRRRAAVRARRANTGSARIRLSIERVEELPQLHQQAVERVAVRADEPRRLRPRALRGAARDAGRARGARHAGALDPVAAAGARRRTSTPRSRLPLQRRGERDLPLRVGRAVRLVHRAREAARCTSPRTPASRSRRSAPRAATSCRACSRTCSRRRCGCSTRSRRTSPRRSGRSCRSRRSCRAR